MKKLFLAIAILFLSAASVQAQATPTATPATPTATPTSAGISVVPVAPSVAHGTSLQLTATFNGQTVPATWISSNPAAATVSTTGLVTGVAAGMSTVQAQYNGNVGWTTVTVY